MPPHEFTAIVLFFQQLALALAGAACLWGFFFSIETQNTEEEGKREILKTITDKLFIPFFFGFILASLLWCFRVFAGNVFSLRYENLFYHFTSFTEYISQTIPLLWGIFISISLLLSFFILLDKKRFSSLSRILYFVNFILVFVLISFPTKFEAFDSGQFFFIKHGFPLIFTLGTVAIVDFLFFFTRLSLRAKRVVFPYIPTLHKIVWTGLGITFLTDWASTSQIILTPQFYFVQTVIAIIIINGMLFTGPLMETLISGVSDRRVKPMERKWGIISGISGVISFSSWTTLTFMAFFMDAPLSYSMLMYIYVIKLAVIYVIYLILEHMTDIPVSFMNTN